MWVGEKPPVLKSMMTLPAVVPWAVPSDRSYLPDATMRPSNSSARTRPSSVGRHWRLRGGKHSKKVVTRSVAWLCRSARSKSPQVRSQSPRLSVPLAARAIVSATRSAGVGGPDHDTPTSMARWASVPRANGTDQAKSPSSSAR